MSPHRVWRSALLAAAVAQAGWSGALLAQTETENFTTAPTDWVSAGPTVEEGFNNYGFSPSTNETGGASPAGEAGGKIHRDNTRSHYADVTLGGLLTDTSSFTASGEFFIGNFVNANSENVIGYLEKDNAGLPGDDFEGGRNWLGLMVGDGGNTAGGEMSFRARIYDSTAGGGQSGRYDGTSMVVNQADAKRFDLAYDGTVRQLTVRLFNAAGEVLNTSVATMPGDKVFAVDTYGVSVGTTGEPNPIEESHRFFFDGTTYSRAVTGDFDGDKVVEPEDFDLLGVELRKPAAEADDRMFDVNNNDGDGAISLADRDAILTAINKKLGDTDLDGDVDLNDLGNLASGFQQAGATRGRGDTDLDADVDLNDLGNLASNFSAGRAAAYAEFEALVPEPSTLSLLAIGAAGLLRRRRA